MKKNIDIIVLGATGFTGKCAAKMLASLTRGTYCDIIWAVAGRSKEKMKKLIAELSKTGADTSNFTAVEIDVRNFESLKKSLTTTKVVINCTGPNCILSEPIVKACIETGTHYVDISAEMLHILQLYRDYNKRAEDANTLIVPSCGYASIPLEIGMVYLERQFQGILHSTECYMELFLPICLFRNAIIHNGTCTSTVHVMETYKEHLELWGEMFPSIKDEPMELKKPFFHQHNRRLWFPTPGPDANVAMMSQQYLYEKIKKKPVHVRAYATVEKLWHFIIVPIMYIYYYLSYFKCFRMLLINFPSFFTIGMVSERGPTDETRRNSKFKFTLNGKGWDKEDDLKSEPPKSLSVEVTAVDPGYDATAAAIIMCAITILKEPSNIPKGGVVTPGAAFYRTDLISRLMETGYKFEVLKSA